MEKLLNSPPIMSVSEFRRLTGKETTHLSDDEVVECIKHLEFLAEMFIQKEVNRNETEKVKQLKDEGN